MSVLGWAAAGEVDVRVFLNDVRHNSLNHTAQSCRVLSAEVQNMSKNNHDNTL